MPGAGGRREGAGAIPAGADRHANRGQLVLGLDDAEILLARFRIGAEFLAEALEPVHQRSRGRDRIPGTEGGAGIDTAQRGSGITVDQDMALCRVHRLDPQWQRIGIMFADIVEAEIDRGHIGLDQVRLGPEHLLDHGADDLDINPGQTGNGADIGHILHQHAGAGIVELGIAQARQRHADGSDVLAGMQFRARPGIIIEQIAARRDFGEIALVGLGIHRDDEIGRAGTRHIGVLGDADLEPGRQALDVGWEQVLANHGHAHAEDRLHQQAIGTGRAGAVHIADLDDKVVDADIRHGVHDVLHSAAMLRASSAT